jgi:hypothetical protein
MDCVQGMGLSVQPTRPREVDGVHDQLGHEIFEGRPPSLEFVAKARLTLLVAPL